MATRVNVGDLSAKLEGLNKRTRTASSGKYFDSVVLPDHEFPEGVYRTVSLHTLKKNPFDKLVAKVNSSVLSRLHVGRTVGKPDVYMMTVKLKSSQLKTAFSSTALKRLGLSVSDVKLVVNSGGYTNVHTVFTEKPQTAALILAYLHSRFPA